MELTGNHMNTSTVVYVINAILTMCFMALAWTGKITWTQAMALVGALLVPSAGHVALQNKSSSTAEPVKSSTPGENKPS